VKGLGRKFLIGAVLGVIVVAAMLLYADVNKLMASLEVFNWWMLGPVIGLTLVNYALRFIKWHWYLKILGAKVSVGDSALVFVSGLSMAITPGKFGELIKAYLLSERAGVPATTTAPVVVGERLTDFIALIVLALTGVASTRFGVSVMAVSIVGTLAFLGIIASKRLSLTLIDWIAKLPLGSRIAPKLKEMYEAMSRLVRPTPLIVTTFLSVAAWFCECVGFYLILSGLPGVSLDLETATFVYAFATIFGAVTMLPGGLGVTDGSMITMTTSFGLAKSNPIATAATLLIRVCTLWFAVAIGLVGLAIFRKTTPPQSDRKDVLSEANG
jgi:uncharacterized protein (TIRG00374 family)